MFFYCGSDCCRQKRKMPENKQITKVIAVMNLRLQNPFVFLYTEKKTINVCHKLWFSDSHNFNQNFIQNRKYQMQTLISHFVFHYLMHSQILPLLN